VFFPLVAPVLLVARRHRRETSVRERYDSALAASGYVFALSVYLGVIASMPAEFQVGEELTTRPDPGGLFAPVVEALYALPPALSFLVPLAGALLVYAVHRRFQS